jgi:hypothetical protein
MEERRHEEEEEEEEDRFLFCTWHWHYRRGSSLKGRAISSKSGTTIIKSTSNSIASSLEGK